MNTLTDEIAATAARMVVEEGLEYGPAKRRAARQLGLTGRVGLPDNDALEAAVREYIEIFCADTQPAELYELRRMALVWMERMARFRPHIAGAVWQGTATRLSDIYIQLFCDDSKSAEIELIDRQVVFDATTVQGFQGEAVEALSIHERSMSLRCDVGVHLLVYDFDDLRGALRPDDQGRRPRGDAAALKNRMEMNQND